MWQKFKAIIQSINLQGFYNSLGGRSWIIIVFFAITAFVLAWYGKLNGAYAMAISALSGFHVGRAIAQDYHERKCKEQK